MLIVERGAELIGDGSQNNLDPTLRVSSKRAARFYLAGDVLRENSDF
jgi:hypothetical protein